MFAWELLFTNPFSPIKCHYISLKIFLFVCDNAKKKGLGNFPEKMRAFSSWCLFPIFVLSYRLEFEFKILYLYILRWNAGGSVLKGLYTPCYDKHFLFISTVIEGECLFQSANNLTWTEAQAFCRRNQSSLIPGTEGHLPYPHWTGLYRRLSDWIHVLGKRKTNSCW